jgi:DNA-binding winged helix-turn-helix (wHTH) protein
VLNFGLRGRFFVSDNPSSRLIRFSTFEVDLHTGEMRQRGQKVKLQEQPMQVLAALLERPGELVTREELRRKLWPADTFVDFDHSLNAAIKRLRDALGESAESPIFVETMARRGYRFIAPVISPSNGASASTGTGVVSAAKPGTSRFLRAPITVASLAAIPIVILVWVLWWRPPQGADVIERRLTANSLENNVSGSVISPDGRFLAYSDHTGIYLKQVRTGETHSIYLPENFSAYVADWFPDGSHLLVCREEQPDKRSLWSVSLFGGSPRQLTNDGAGGAVSPDGEYIAFQRFGFGQEEWVMHSDGTEPVKVAADKGSWVGPPTWSPDGNRIAYFKQAIDQPLAENLVASVEHLSQPRVAPDGSEILYISTPKSATPQAISSIFAIPIGGGTPRLVLRDVGIWNVQCARLPSTICLYSITKGDTIETFRFDVRNGKSSDPPQVDPSCNWSLSRDGLQRAMTCPRPEGTIRLRSTLTGKTHDVPVKGWNELGGIEWAADGRSILVAGVTPERESALLKVTLDGKVSVLLRSGNPEILAAIPSPDGRSLVIAEATRSNDVWQIENF